MNYKVEVDKILNKAVYVQNDVIEKINNGFKDKITKDTMKALVYASTLDVLNDLKKLSKKITSENDNHNSK